MQRRTMVNGIAGLALVALIALGIITLLRSGIRVVPPTAVPTPMPMTRYTNDVAGFSLKYPSGWEVEAREGLGSVTEITSPDMEGAETFRMEVLPDTKPVAQTLTEWLDALENQQQAMFGPVPDTLVRARTVVQEGPTEAIEVRTTGPEGAMLVRYVASGASVYTLTAYPSSEAQEQMFHQIADSFAVTVNFNRI